MKQYDINNYKADILKYYGGEDYAEEKECFKTKEIVSQSLDIAPFALVKAIRTGEEVLTAGGLITQIICIKWGN